MPNDTALPEGKERQKISSAYMKSKWQLSKTLSPSLKAAPSHSSHTQQSLSSETFLTCKRSRKTPKTERIQK